MTEKTFMVKMDDTEYCANNIETQSRAFCCFNYKTCKGNLDKRPEWCPLVAVYESTVGIVKDSQLDEVKVWVEE